MSIMNLQGQKFNRLTVLKLLEKRRYSGYRDWECLCDCGNITNATTKSLISGRTKSCGCYQKDFMRTIRSLPKGEAEVRSRIRSYVKAAIKRKLEFSLKDCEFKDITSKNCQYCGSPPINGIDRVDSSKGYTRDNCVPCCKRCNIAKNNMGIDEFYSWIERVYNHQIEALL